MPASKKSSLVNSQKKLGIIAGGGELPYRLVNACRENGQPYFIVAFEGQTDPTILPGSDYMITRLGAAGRILNTLKAHGIEDLVIIGSIRRPSLPELRPDMRTFRFFTKLGLRAMGDDSLLSALRRELEDEGFVIRGIQDYVPDLLAMEGDYSRVRPKKGDWQDIDRGIEVSQALGGLDVGQSVIVQEGLVLGVEAAEGTDALISRCGGYKRKGRGGVLVKTCKPQQDQDLDLPTVGIRTLRMCQKAGLNGLVIHAYRSILINPQEVAEYANRNKMFVVGVDIDNYKPKS